jgi:Chalcone isomerase-like
MSAMMVPRALRESMDKTRNQQSLPWSRRRWLATASIAWLPLATSVARGDDAPVIVAGQPFERRVRVAGSELQLNGTGVRGWYKAYAAGLYLGTPSSDPSQVAAQPGPKRLQLRMRFNLPASEFAKAFRIGVTRNVAPAEVPKLQTRIAAFEAEVNAIDEVHNGDVIDLDFEPGRGLVFKVNGEPQGSPIAGSDFYAALLLAFVGDKPYDDKLKAGLLGRTG